MPNVGGLDAVGALARLRRHGVIVREHPDVYRMSGVAPSSEQHLRAALAWAGPMAAAAGRSAGRIYGLEGIVDPRPEIAVPSTLRARHDRIIVHHTRLGGFTREHPMVDQGRRWHDDPADFDRDQRKWSIPARHGFRLLFATWKQVIEEPDRLIGEVRAALAAHP